MLTANSFIDVPSDAFIDLMHLSQVVLGLGMTLIRCFLDPHIILPGSIIFEEQLALTERRICVNLYFSPLLNECQTGYHSQFVAKLIRDV